MMMLNSLKAKTLKIAYKLKDLKLF